MKTVYTIEDLASRELLDAGCDKPAKLAVIGDPIQHSKSPQMHQAALDAQDRDLRYIRVHVEPGRVQEALQRMSALGFIGTNVTIPHKLEVMECCDELSKEAEQIGAVNTIHFTPEGWIGHNTDGPGLAYALEYMFNTSFDKASTLIIGAGGGAGRAIAIQAALDKCPKLTLANRTVSKLDSIAEAIRSIHPTCDLQLIGLTDSELSNVDTEIIINASSLGMKPEDPIPFPSEALKPEHKLYDAVYTPPLTKFLEAGQRKGCATANGEYMLVFQGSLSYKRWFDLQDRDSFNDALQKMLSVFSNKC